MEQTTVFCDHRASYNPEAAADAWEHVKHLFGSLSLLNWYTTIMKSNLTQAANSSFSMDDFAKALNNMITSFKGTGSARQGVPI